MRLRQRIITVLRLPIVVRDDPKRRAEARRFVDSGAADRLPLSEFEERFEITEVDYDANVAGYPASGMYKPERSEEQVKHRQATDDFVKA